MTGEADLLVLAAGLDGVALGAGLGEDLLAVIRRHCDSGKAEIVDNCRRSNKQKFKRTCRYGYLSICLLPIHKCSIYKHL